VKTALRGGGRHQVKGEKGTRRKKFSGKLSVMTLASYESSSDEVLGTTALQSPNQPMFSVTCNSFTFVQLLISRGKW